jgi:hypothetical protein
MLSDNYLPLTNNITDYTHFCFRSEHDINLYYDIIALNNNPGFSFIELSEMILAKSNIHA